MDMLKLIARIGDQQIAISADQVESVVEIDAITPVPLAAPHIAGLAALRSRVLTIIDTYAALEIGRSPREGLLQAIVVTIDHHLYGLLVDEVVDCRRDRGRARAAACRARRAAGPMPRWASSSMTGRRCSSSIRRASSPARSGRAGAA